MEHTINNYDYFFGNGRLLNGARYQPRSHVYLGQTERLQSICLLFIF